jgi:hypothetical protein
MYYKHSGEVPAAGLVTGFLGSLAAAFVLAWVYAYGILYIPIIQITFILTFVFAAALGGASSFFLRWSKVRNVTIARCLTVLMALFGLYAAWAAWVHGFLERGDNHETGPLELFYRPDLLVGIIVQINEVGPWSIGNFGSSGSHEPEKGFFVWVVWLIEAGVILVTPNLFATSFMDDTFCEGCDVWCDRREGLALIPLNGGQHALRDKLEEREWASIVGPVDPRCHCRLDVHSCPKCDGTHTLTASVLTHGVDSKGRPTVNVVRWVDKLILTKEELAALVAALRSPPPKKTA